MGVYTYRGVTRREDPSLGAWGAWLIEGPGIDHEHRYLLWKLEHEEDVKQAVEAMNVAFLAGVANGPR